ncbi:MAG: hypothetical protein NT030_02455 [Candidatus Saganbacteria bacterium]|nr:hypothetical protein [Candidatus Saganbacteria bacterium]
MSIREVARNIYRGAQNYNYFKSRFLRNYGIKDLLLSGVLGFDSTKERLEWVNKMQVSTAEKQVEAGAISLRQYFFLFGGEMTGDYLRRISRVVSLPSDKVGEIFKGFIVEINIARSYCISSIRKGDNVSASKSLLGMYDRELKKIMIPGIFI